MKNKTLFGSFLLLSIILVSIWGTSCTTGQQSAAPPGEKLITVLNPAISSKMTERVPLTARSDTLEGKDASEFAPGDHDHSWVEISGRPSGLDDGDDVGIETETDPTVPSYLKNGVSWVEILGRPSGLDDGDDVGVTTETDPTV